MADLMVSAKAFCRALVKGALAWSPPSLLLTLSVLLLESCVSDLESDSELGLELEVLGPAGGCTASSPWRSLCHPWPGGTGSDKAGGWQVLDLGQQARWRAGGGASLPLVALLEDMVMNKLLMMYCVLLAWSVLFHWQSFLLRSFHKPGMSKFSLAGRIVHRPMVRVKYKT